MIVGEGSSRMLTCADNVRSRPSIDIASLACASDSIRGGIMRTSGILVTTTIVDQAAVCQRVNHRSCPCVADAFVPVQLVLASVPKLVKPVLQVHLTSFVVASCEQMAFFSHPPLLTRQLS